MFLGNQQKYRGFGVDLSQKTDQEVYQLMELRYGPAFTQGIRDSLEATKVREIQYLEMKQMVEIQFRFRERVRGVVDNYRAWKRDYEAETDAVEKVYKAYDGIFLRGQLNDAWRMYVTVTRDYHEMYRTYMKQIEDKKRAPFSYDTYYKKAA